MTVALALIRRNLRLYLREPVAVLLSLLAPLILFGLYALVLGNLQLENLTGRFPAAPGGAVDGFLDAWIIAGVATVSTFTTGLAALNVFVGDTVKGRFRDFLVSPVRRWQLVTGYLVASFLVALVISALIVAAGQVYLLARGHPAMGPAALLHCLGAVALSAAAFSAISSLTVTFVGSDSAFSAVSTIAGTLIGFLAGAFIPPGALPVRAADVLSVLPFGQAATLIREPLTAGAVDELTGGRAEARTALADFYGITGTLGTGTTIAMLVAVLVVFAALGVVRIGRRIR